MDRAARNQEIAARVVDAGWTLTEAGREYALSRERIRQIVQAVRPGTVLSVRARERASTEARERQAARAAREAEARDRARFTRIEPPIPYRLQYTDEEMLQVIRDFTAETGAAPTTTTWNRKPTPTSYARRFGSWRAAKQAAGVSPDAIRSPGGVDRWWTEQECVEMVARFLATGDADSGERYGLSHYQRWRRDQPPGSVPSRSLIILRFGSWSAARDRALSLLESEGIVGRAG
jgi:Homing endonuclease associated repeat